MNLEVGKRSTAFTARSLALVLVAVTFGLIAIAAAYSSLGTGTPPATSSGRLSSSLSSSSSTIQSSLLQQSSVVGYPLAWGTTRPVTCEGTGGFCLTDIYLGFAGQNTTNTSSVTTMIQGIWPTVINSSTTTVTNVITIFPPVNDTGTTIVDIFAYVQDALTGQNATRPDGGGPVVGNSCNLQPTGLTKCGVDAPFGLAVPSGDPYRVTLFVTSQYEPCSLLRPGSLCASQLLAPPVTFIS